MEVRKDIKLERETVKETDDQVPLGPVMLGLPSGEAYGFDADSITLISISHVAKGKMIVAVAAGDLDGRRVATLAQFTAAQARNFAASMLRSADEIDGGGVTN